MTLKSRKKRKSTDRGEFGFAMARNTAFLAVLSLWDKRKNEGLKQSELAKIIGRDAGWVNNQLKGPGNWTMRTFGELVEALEGEVEIQVTDRNEFKQNLANFDAYAVHDERKSTSAEVRFTSAPNKKLIPSLPKGPEFIADNKLSIGAPLIGMIAQ